ncbi:diadenylate cyclase [Metamycoplasma salivarium]|uniref:Membrane protein n=2 Tax=Metamycoplasma salivarium TaxID=2124 RepID=A0A448ZYB6_METSV|nr:diadenylate cyclase [Metamycoplasma salivarium]CAD7361056.1 membrane protein [Metamycoplasma salivarium]VEU56252.1 membrane protein [Metamycoplasma salivarium]
MRNEVVLYVILTLLILVVLGAFIRYLVMLVNRINVSKRNRSNLGESTRIRLIHQIREALEYLSKNKIGAIITIEQKENLDMLRTDGVIIDANISSSLIISIFNKYCPLHDGAIIIRGSKIYYAATYYKITKKSIDNHYGARHRAALGISEISDSITLVVSEETGGISVAKKGVLSTIENSQVQEVLVNIFKEDQTE